MINNFKYYWLLELEQNILIQKESIEKLLIAEGIEMTQTEMAEFLHVFYYICFGKENELPIALLPQVPQFGAFKDKIQDTQKKLAVNAGIVMQMSKNSREDILQDMVLSFNEALIKIFPNYIIRDTSVKIDQNKTEITHQQIIDDLMGYLISKSSSFDTQFQNKLAQSDFCQLVILAALDLDKLLPQNYFSLTPALHQIFKQEINFAQTKLIEIGGTLIRDGLSGDNVLDYILNLVRNSISKKFPGCIVLFKI